MSRVVRTRVPGSRGGRRFSFGSGYLVALGRVLTAAHVLVPPGMDPPPTAGQPCEILCSGPGEIWRPGEALWVEPEFDLAVVSVDAGRDLGRMRWGRVDGDGPLFWSAVGFPLASLDDAGRQPEHAWGETSAITQAPAQKLGLTVNSRHARPPGAGSGWAGLSGAAVLCDQRLVGVVIEDPAGYEGSLTARRLDAIADDPSLHEALGGRVVLEPVSGRRLEPGLRDLRVVLPAAVASFTGRHGELAELVDSGMGPMVVTQALAGLGGVGKTALALEYAHRRFYFDNAVDLVWWFTASDRLSLTSAMARLYEQLTGVSAGEDSVLSATRLRNWLENSPHRWLLVFDNADDAGVLGDLVPRVGTGQVLITSRRTDWSALGATVHRLGVLSLDESVALLSRTTGRDDEVDARLLADELGGLAVALRQAGAFIAKTGWDYRRYLEMLRTRPLRLHSEDLAGVGTTLAQVWESSLDQVTRSGQHGPLPLEVLGVLAYFAAEDVPRRLLATPAIDGEAVLGGDTLDVELALVGLAQYSLISLQPDSISLHRLVQHLTRSHLQDRGAAVDHASAAVRLLRGVLGQPGLTADDVTHLLPHVRESTSHAIARSAVPQEVAELLNAVALDRIDTGQLDVARSLLGRALHLATDCLGPDHPATLKTRDTVAWCLGVAGRVEESVGEFDTLVDDERRVLGHNHQDTLRTRHNRAHWLGQAGKVDEAVAEFQALLVDHRREFGPDHPDTLKTRGRLARWLREAGRLEEALAQFQAQLVDQLRVLGRYHRDTLRTRGSLCRWIAEAGRVDEALAQYESLLVDRVRLLGPDHPDTLRTRHGRAYWLGQALAGGRGPRPVRISTP
jgi:tetratricopeptide (TPR) repeat protein